MSRRPRLIARIRRRSPEGEGGQALVEFALLLPILLVILFGVLDIGKAFNYWNDQTHLASEASRWAAVNKDPNTISGCNGMTLAQCIKNEADTTQLRAGVTVTICAVGGNAVGNPIRATVTYPYNWMPFIKNTLGLNPTTSISVSSTMRQEVAGNFAAC